MSKTRSYAFTINNYLDKDIDIFNTLTTHRYWIYGIEKGTEGTPHLQCYIYFKNPTAFLTIKNKFPTAHIESAQGNPQQNRDYCSKDGDFKESGELPTQGKAQFQRVEEAMENPTENWGNYKNNFKAYNDFKLKAQKTLPKTKPIMKLVSSFDEIAPHLENDAYIVSTWNNDIFELYRGESVVVIDLEFHTLSGPDLKTIENWVSYGLTPKYKDGYQVGRVTATHLYICSTDKYKHLSKLKILSIVTDEENGIFEEQEKAIQEEI